jgi:MFS family permease
MRDLPIEEIVGQTNEPSPTSRRGLDWFVFFVANLQTGFGPFISVYLTVQKWSQVDIGIILSIGSIAGLLSQVPGGWVVDAARSKLRIAMMLAIIAIGVSALMIAAFPVFGLMIGAELIHASASSVLGPGIAALTLGLVGHAAISQRLGRNARFAAMGSGIAAGVMGAIGYLLSPRTVFYVTAALAVPTLLALRRIREVEVDPKRCHGGMSPGDNNGPLSLGQLLRIPALIGITASVLLFQVANAAMLPLVGSAITMRSSHLATPLVAAAIVAPQLVVAAISPSVGELAQSWGRRPVLLIGFGALVVRGALLAWTIDPAVIVAVQMLDGISGAVLGILIPLILADITQGTGRFNLAQGIVGSAIGIGAAVSTILAGYMADHWGIFAALLGLTGMGLCGFVVVLSVMPETRPAP